MSKLEDDTLPGADLEDNGYSLLSEFEEHEETESEGEEGAAPDPKEARDIAEGRNLNNSFNGSSYPESWDHLHFDKGANPQFQYKAKQNNIFELAATLFS